MLRSAVLKSLLIVGRADSPVMKSFHISLGVGWMPEK